MLKSPKPLRVYTCTPVEFGGGPDFFARDSGLLCRGFQEAGCEAYAVMPGESQIEDEPDLIRTSYSNLESAEWWRTHQLDIVVLYAWGRPKFLKVAKAIHDAGVFLLLNQDNSGLVSPLVSLAGWWREQKILTGFSGDQRNYAALLKQVLRGISVGLFVTDPLRALHLKQGNIIACVSPAAAAHYRKLCKIYGGGELSKRVHVIPHPVEPIFWFSPDEAPKLRQIVCVGRWSDRIQKRASLLLKVVEQATSIDPTLLVEIVGELTEELESWHHSLEKDLQSRVKLRGKIGRVELALILRASQVFYSPSAFESFGIAAGEALCSGCSVVAAHSPSMGSFGWFASENSGTLAVMDDVSGHVDALQTELTHWTLKQRSPTDISGVWTSRLHARNVAAGILEMKRHFVG